MKPKEVKRIEINETEIRKKFNEKRTTKKTKKRIN